jgi:ornithine carbamoyltransferase
VTFAEVLTTLHGKHFLKETDLTADEVVALLDLAAALKRAKRAGVERPTLAGRHVALIFEKTSTRTRCAFEVAAGDQGAFTTYLGPSGSQIGHKESMKDTARVLGRMYDAIEYRGFGQAQAQTLAEHAGVPVWNGLTDEFHPTQSLCDVFTMREHSDKPLRDISYCYLGDARNNMGNSLMLMGALLGMDVRLGAPEQLWPEPELVRQAHGLAAAAGGRVTLTADPHAAVRGVDFVHTDVWVSMGEPKDVWAERIALLRPYQVDAATMAATGNAGTRFMHCLPAYHNRETVVGEQIYADHGLDGLEVTEDVFESSASIVFDQAENRMHTIKAVMVATLGSPRDAAPDEPPS